MENRVLFVDGNLANLNENKTSIELGFDIPCDTTDSLESKTLKHKEYPLVFVHLSTHAGQEKPASVVRRYQKNAFIVGVGGEWKSHYSEEDLKDCDGFYRKAGPVNFFDYVEELLNKTGVIQK